ncbi:MAG TPA: bifunctional DNA primase/polymerase [Burkholderiales bacterium]|nr:bifunctional DNA primase/polymerase [Burkholderiales bacterium]
MTNIETKMLGIALGLANGGLPVFPIAPGQKSPPLIKGWQKQATTDEAQIREWWACYPTDSNVGVHAAGLLIVDVDPKKGGAESLKALEAEIPLAETYTVSTPSGGEHRYFSLPQGVEIANGVDTLGPGLDIRTTGGYVVAEGSKTEKGAYTVVKATEITEAHPELIRRCKAAAKPKHERRKDAPPIVTDPEQAVARAREFLETYPVAEEDKGGDFRTFKAACHVRDFGVPQERAAEALSDWNKRCSPPWDTDELETKIANSYQYARGEQGAMSPEAMFDRVPAEQQQPKAKAKFKPNTRSARYLKTTEFKPIAFTIEALLPEGAFLLVAAPKIGKSWLALQIGVAVATGGKVLGFKAKKGKVLVLALEDGDRRLKSRLTKLGLDDLPDDALDNLHFETEWPRSNDGGLEALEAWMDENPDTRLIVIDVLECFRPEANAKENAYSQDYKALKAIQQFAGRRGISVVIVHHTRKAHSDDAMTRISGTNGLAGAADGALILDRKDRGEAGVLELHARDASDGAYALRFLEGRWEMVGPAAQVAKTHLQGAILMALRTEGKPMLQTQIAKAIGRAQATVSQALRVMLREKIVEHGEGGYTATSSGNEFESTPGAAPFETEGD